MKQAKATLIWCTKFMMATARKKVLPQKELTITESNVAPEHLLRRAQFDCFAAEIMQLERKSEIENNSSLFKSIRNHLIWKKLESSECMG